MLGLDGPSRKRLLLAAKLHDIGKVGLPEAILNKRGRLTEAEFAVVREHPVTGERILTRSFATPSCCRPSAAITSVSTARAIPTGWPARRRRCWHA